MNIRTKYHGEINIPENQTIQFQQGIPGFIEEKRFVVLPFEEGSPYFILQSLHTEELAFILGNPFVLFVDYEYQLSDQIVSLLNIEASEHVATYVILNVKDPFHLTTANLQAPIVINTKNNHGKQLILNDKRYSTKHLILEKSTSLEQEG